MGWNAPAVGTSRKYVALIEQERRTEIESLLGGRTGPNAAEQAQLPEKPPSPESRLLPISSAEKANYLHLDEFSHRTGWRLSADWLQNRRIWPSVTYSLGRGPETDFDALAQRGSNPVQHTQRVPFVIRILQARDDRRPGSNPLGQFGLGKTGLVAGCINSMFAKTSALMAIRLLTHRTFRQRRFTAAPIIGRYLCIQPHQRGVPARSAQRHLENT